MLQSLRELHRSLVFTFQHMPGIPPSIIPRLRPFPLTCHRQRPLYVVAALAHKELMIKPAQGVTTGREYNKLEGDRNEKRWDAYKKREESGKTNDELYL